MCLFGVLVVYWCKLGKVIVNWARNYLSLHFYVFSGHTHIHPSSLSRSSYFKCLERPRLGWTKARSAELLLGRPSEWQEANYLIHHCCLAGSLPEVSYYLLCPNTLTLGASASTTVLCSCWIDDPLIMIWWSLLILQFFNVIFEWCEHSNFCPRLVSTGLRYLFPSFHFQFLCVFMMKWACCYEACCSLDF